MSIIAASATFTQGDAKRLLDLYVRVKLFTAVGKAQTVVKNEAQALCPVDTGALRDSIRENDLVDDGKRVVGDVSANMPYGSFVEFGTGLRGSGSYPFPLPQEGVPITGSWIYDYRGINWKGMVARPYLRPSLDSARRQILEQFGV